MTMTEKTATVEKVACEVCLKEVPMSEAKVAEAADYVVYVCGLECYDKWVRQAQESAAPSDSPVR